MDTIILCGGRGMRAWPLTDEVPKPLLQVGGEELVAHIMRQYASHGFRRFILCVGYKPEAFRMAFPLERAQDMGIDIDFCDSGPGAGTTMRISQAMLMCEGERVNVTYGDGLADVDLGKVVRMSERPGVSAVVTAIQPKSRFGELMLDGDRVRMFVEKPFSRRWVNGGFMVLDRRAVAKCTEYAARDASSMFVKDAMRELVALGVVGAHKHKGFWACVDTAKDLDELNDAWSRGERPWLA